MNLTVFESDLRWELASILFFLLTGMALNSCKKALSRKYNSHGVQCCRVSPSHSFSGTEVKTKQNTCPKHIHKSLPESPTFLNK